MRIIFLRYLPRALLYFFTDNTLTGQILTHIVRWFDEALFTHVAWSVSLYVCVLCMCVSCAKMAEPIEIPFGCRHSTAQYRYLIEVQIPHWKRNYWGGHVPVRHNILPDECLSSAGSGRVNSSLRGVTTADCNVGCVTAIRRCGSFPTFFGHLLLLAAAATAICWSSSVDQCKFDIHCEPKKQNIRFLFITSPNANRFSKFLHQ